MPQFTSLSPHSVYLQPGIVVITRIDCLESCDFQVQTVNHPSGSGLRRQYAELERGSQAVESGLLRLQATASPKRPEKYAD